MPAPTPVCGAPARAGPEWRQHPRPSPYESYESRNESPKPITGDGVYVFVTSSPFVLCVRCGAELSPPPPSLCPRCEGPPLLDGRYALLEILGRSAERTTYRARRLSDGAEVAIKELLFRRMASWKSEALFQREIRALRELDHPSVPRAIDAIEVDDGPRSGLYLVRELVSGQSLEAELGGRPASASVVLRIAAELLDVVADLHALSPPIVHRDLTLSNVLRRDDGRLVLVDLGAVKDTLAAASGGSTLVGTYGYVAPEQLRGAASPASDVYGIGAMAVALLAGKPAHQLLDARHRLDMRAVPGGAMRALLERMLAADPRARPRARSAARAMRDIASGKTASQRRAVPIALTALFLATSLSWAALSGSASSSTPPRAEPTARPASASAPATTPVTTPPSFPAGFVVPPLAPDPHPRVFLEPPLDWTPACEARGDCTPVATSFAGMALSAECGPLLGPGDAPAASEAANATERTIGGLVFSCTASQQRGVFCNVLCTARSSDGWRDAATVVRAIGDEHGAAETADETTTATGLDHYTRQRAWHWRAPDDGTFGPEVLLLVRRTFAEPALRDSGMEEVTISYRGAFSGSGSRSPG